MPYFARSLPDLKPRNTTFLSAQRLRCRYRVHLPHATSKRRFILMSTCRSISPSSLTVYLVCSCVGCLLNDCLHVRTFFLCCMLLVHLSPLCTFILPGSRHTFYRLIRSLFIFHFDRASASTLPSWGHMSPFQRLIALRADHPISLMYWRVFECAFSLHCCSTFFGSASRMAFFFFVGSHHRMHRFSICVSVAAESFCQRFLPSLCAA